MRDIQSAKYEEEVERIQRTGQSPPAEVKGMAQPAPVKTESPATVTDGQIWNSLASW